MPSVSNCSMYCITALVYYRCNVCSLYGFYIEFAYRYREFSSKRLKLKIKFLRVIILPCLQRLKKKRIRIKTVNAHHCTVFSSLHLPLPLSFARSEMSVQARSREHDELEKSRPLFTPFRCLTSRPTAPYLLGSGWC